MPTTRNRWQTEIQSQSPRQPRPTSSSKKSTNPQRRPIDASPPRQVQQGNRSCTASDSPKDLPDPSVQHDLNPRSPKRRRISSPDNGPAMEAEQEHRSEFQEPQSTTATDCINEAAAVTPTAKGGLAGVSRVTPAVPMPATPNMRTQVDNLPVLSNFASQVLSVLAKATPSEALQLVRDSTSNAARDYAMVRSLFDPMRRLYDTGSPFLSPQTLGLTESSQVEILRKANQAIYMSSIFTGEIGLRDMDQNFLEVFVPEHGRLLKALGSIYLELKTQAFITARRTGAAEPLVVMADLFPSDMENRLLHKRPGAKTLAPSEVDFLNRIASRREILLADVKNNTLDELPSRYRWEDFSREVSTYLAKNHDGTSPITPGTPAEQQTSAGLSSAAPLPQGRMEGQFSIHAPPLPITGPGPLFSSPQPTPLSSAAPAPSLLDDFVAQAARAAEIAMQGPTEDRHTPPPKQPTQHELVQYTQVQPQFQHYKPSSPSSTVTGASPIPGSDGEVPHSSQTAPTQVLYERARLFASAKSMPSTRKPSNPSQRRPWTPEEESALMTGLDQVKGPHWSQILAMYGPGGTINESLKDRNQVQLKDKARNLKLFFLKSRTEVPYYLQYVTGDLKSRAPGQASKQEARERERMQYDESRAHFDGLQGIMALAGGNNSLLESSQSPVPSMGEDPTSEAAEMENEAEPESNYDPQMADVEAMIARAAAQASASLDTTGWN